MPCAALRRRPDAHTLVQVTWEQLAEHNTPQDLWVAIRGKVYDLTTYQNRHPGGFRLMQLGAGRDVTHLFEAYHPLRCDQERDKTLPSSPSFSLYYRGGPVATPPLAPWSRRGC
jgi:predicted heme/steroid binding protein